MKLNTWVIALLPFALCSCVVSKNPASDQKASSVDSRLLGAWNYGGDYFFVGKAPQDAGGPGGAMLAYWLTFRGDVVTSSPEPLWFFVSSIGDERYANILWDWKPEVRAKHEVLTPADFFAERLTWPRKSDYLILKYEVRGDRVQLWDMDHEAVARVVKDGTIKGSEKLGWLPTVTLSETTESLRSLLAQPSSKAFFRLFREMRV
jgi:hypothetical protein